MFGEGCYISLKNVLSAYLLRSLYRHLTRVQGVAGVLKDFTGTARLVLLPTQPADEEQLGGAFS